MTEEQQKELAQIFEAMGNAKGNFVIGQVMGTQINYFGSSPQKPTQTKQTKVEEKEDTKDEDNAKTEGQGADNPTSDSRAEILNQLLALADKGEWINGITSDDIKTMLKKVLGKEETILDGKEAKQSETLWKQLESGRGDRVRIVWQKLIGYFIDKRLLSQAVGAPALNKMFFGNDEGYSNIDKGRPSKKLMTLDFKNTLPLLDNYLPKK